MCNFETALLEVIITIFMRSSCSGTVEFLQLRVAKIQFTKPEKLFGVRWLDSAFLRRGLTRRSPFQRSMPIYSSTQPVKPGCKKERRQAAALQISKSHTSYKPNSSRRDAIAPLPDPTPATA